MRAEIKEVIPKMSGGQLYSSATEVVCCPVRDPRLRVSVAGRVTWETSPTERPVIRLEGLGFRV